MSVFRRLAAVAIASVLSVSAALADPPKEGDPAPDVRVKATQIKKVLPDAKGDTLSIADFKGKKHVVIFYFPKALTKG
jgi:peroxiredoxin